MKEAIIFDCDGVLVDSETLGCVAVARVLQTAGMATDAAAIRAEMTGKSDREMVAIYAARTGLPLDPGEITVRIAEEYMNLAGALQPMPGIIPVLHQLQVLGVPVAVASSGEPSKIAFLLEKAGLKGFFDIICSAAEVPRGKPEPDLFLYAAARLGKDPRDCLVVEDSLYGVMAGKRAGMFTLGYPSSFSAPELLKAGADRVIRSFDELTYIYSRKRPGLGE